MTRKTNLFLRQDTLLGACQGLADDLGISPMWLRVPLAAVILYSPEIAVGAYLVLALVVFASRMIWPVKKAEAVATEAAVEAAPVEVAAKAEQRELAMAA